MPHGSRGGNRQRPVPPARAVVFDQLDDTGTDHHRVRHTGHGDGGFCVPDAEADAHWHAHLGADARHHARDRVGVEVTGAGHALERDVVDVACGDAADFGHALVSRRRSEQEDRIHVRGAQPCGEGFAFLRRIVHDEHAIDASLLRVVHEAVRPVALDRVGIAHQHHRRRRIRLAEGAHHLQHVRRADVLEQRALAGALDHRAVGHRVRERNAEFDHVGARRDHAVHQVDGHIGVRIACGHIGNQRLAALRGQAREGGLDAAHSAPPLTLCPRHDGRQ